MYHDICPQIQRSLEIRRQERIIHYKNTIIFLRDLCDLLNVSHLHHGIGRRLQKDHFCAGAKRILNIVKLRHIYVSKLTIEFTEDLVTNTKRSAINVITQNNVITIFQQIKHCHVCCLSTGKGKSFRSIFQNGHGSFQFLSGWILNARIIITCRNAKGLVTESCRLENGETNRSGNWLATQCSMYYFGIKMQVFLSVKFTVSTFLSHKLSSFLDLYL